MVTSLWDSADDNITWDRLLGAAPPAAVVDQGGKGTAKPIEAKASKAVDAVRPHPPAFPPPWLSKSKGKGKGDDKGKSKVRGKGDGKNKIKRWAAKKGDGKGESKIKNKLHS